MEYPLVSTVIPSYKRADLLPRAIESVLNQTYKNIEIIVVDDNNPGTDERYELEKIMEKYYDNQRVKFVQHDYNKNGSAARNTGISHADGKYICFLDDDNYFFEDKIMKQFQYISEHPEYLAVYCGLTYENKTIMPTKEGDLSYEQLKGTNIIDTNMIMMDLETAKLIGGWDERLKRNQDVAFMLRYFSKGYKIGVVSEPLAYIDLIDRSNVANPKTNERNFDMFFDYYKDELESIEKMKKGAIKRIYVFRYRAVFLNYIKHKKYHLALSLYSRMMLKAPIKFNSSLIDAMIKKVKKEDLNKIS